MPRYNHDPSAVTTSLTVLPKDSYEFLCGRPKAFERTAKAGHQSYGVRIPLTVQGGPMNGKKTVFSMYLHSEGGAQMAKRFQIAVWGKTVNEKNEKEFDAFAVTEDWSFDTETGEVGSGWAAYEGMSVACDVDVEIIQNDKGEDVESQQWGTWVPVG